MPAQSLKSFFGTLASLNRLSILFALASGEKTVTQVARDLRTEQSIVSHGLRRLSAAGLIHVRKDGRERHYRLNQEKTAHVFALANEQMQKRPAPLAISPTPEYMVIIDKEHRFAYFKDFTGQGPEIDVLGKSIYEFIPKFFKAIAKRKFDKIFNSPKPLRWKIPGLDEQRKLRWYAAEIDPVGGGGGGAQALVVNARPLKR
jgi:DNA-binding transcriptional ArsR family regulator